MRRGTLDNKRVPITRGTFDNKKWSHDALLAEIVTSTFQLCNSFVLSRIDFIFGMVLL